MRYFCPEKWRPMALGFLRMKSAAEEEWLPLVQRGEKLLLSHGCDAPGRVYRVFPLQKEEGGIRFVGSTLCLAGRSAASHLEGCSLGLLLCVSLGQGADRALRKAQAEDMALAVVTDALASAMAECACDEAQEEILQESAFSSYCATSRYSPGYGDLGLEYQGDFLKVLDATRRLGVSVSPGGLLLPRKTVTAFLGLKERKN